MGTGARQGRVRACVSVCARARVCASHTPRSLFSFSLSLGRSVYTLSRDFREISEYIPSSTSNNLETLRYSNLSSQLSRRISGFQNERNELGLRSRIDWRRD